MGEHRNIPGFIFLSKHSNMVKQLNGDINYSDVYFEDDQFEGIIAVPKTRTHNLLFIGKSKATHEAIIEIKETPLWFQELYEQTAQVLMKRSRIIKLFD